MTHREWEERVGRQCIPLSGLDPLWREVLIGHLGYAQLVQLLHGESYAPASLDQLGRVVPAGRQRRSPIQAALSRQACRDTVARVLAPAYGIEHPCGAGPSVSGHLHVHASPGPAPTAALPAYAGAPPAPVRLPEHDMLAQRADVYQRWVAQATAASLPAALPPDGPPYHLDLT